MKRRRNGTIPAAAALLALLMLLTLTLASCDAGSSGKKRKNDPSEQLISWGGFSWGPSASSDYWGYSSTPAHKTTMTPTSSEDDLSTVTIPETFSSTGTASEETPSEETPSEETPSEETSGVDDERDGSSTERAFILTPGSTVDDLLTDKDFAYYQLTAEEKGTFIFNLTMDLRDDDYAHVYLTVYRKNDMSNTIFDYEYNVGEVDADKYTRVDLNSPLLGLDAGEYVVMLEWNRCGEGQYSFTANFTATAYCETEPNERVVNASELQLDRSTAGSFYGSSDRRDYYLLTVEEKGTIVFNLRMPLQSDYYGVVNLAVYRQEDVDSTIFDYSYEVGEVDEEKYTEVNLNSPLLGLNPGTYVVEFSSNRCDSEAYYLTAVYTQTDNCEAEPNNRMANASPIALNQPIAGSLNEDDSTYGDRDYFVFTTDHSVSAAVNLKLPLQSSWYATFSLEVFDQNDPDTEIYEYVYEIGEVNRETHTEADLTSDTFNLKPGTYYFRLSSYRCAPDTYTLTVSER